MEKKNFRYGLGKLTTVCPACHRRTFKPYIDLQSGQPLDAKSCGRCNREVNCRYHLTPAEYLANTPNRPTLFLSAAAPAAIDPPSFLSERPPLQDGTELIRDTLFRWMFFLFGNDPGVVRVWKAYRAYHDRALGGSAGFPLIDRFGNFRSTKLMRYDPNGHRCKNALNDAKNVAWKHTGLPGYCFRACFFGEHLVRAFPKATVNIVESEKTALLCAVEYGYGDRQIWVASGGCSGLRGSAEDLRDPHFRLSFLRGRNVRLIPDNDSVERWKECTGELRKFCRSVTVEPVAGLTGSEDLGDLIVRRHT